MKQTNRFFDEGALKVPGALIPEGGKELEGEF